MKSPLLTMDLGPRDAIIHFGMPKTGSTSIQAFLYKGLEGGRHRYLDFGRANPNQFIVTGFPENPRRFRIHQRLALSDEALNEMREFSRRRLTSELKKASNKVAVLSSEAIYGLDREEFRALFRAIKSRARNVYAVGYVRRPKGYMESLFQQYLKSHDVNSLDIEGLFPAYRQKLIKFDALLGRHHVDLWLFDPKQFANGCVVTDFCERLDIPLNKKNIIRSNDGLSLPAVSLLYAYRKYGPGYGLGERALAENRALIKYISSIQGPKLRFHSSLVVPVIEKHASAIAWVSNRLGVDFYEDLSKDDNSAVKGEADLLDIDPETVKWLLDQVSRKKMAELRQGDDPANTVAAAMHVLRERLGEKLDA